MVALPNKFPPFPITPPTFFYSLVKVFHADATFNEQYERIVEGLRKAGLPEGEKKTD